ncbi:pyrroloquinoline quinone-dependent dehydrogenase [Marinicaulis flavus]|uniref:Pyrroloquinoline quinone-dependent dehydrogenase n=2 Tax=Hyphococcus luteus TaxID=2058213 RepID=A0A2S7K8F7_9PROT|nr:pyrroloquinoline quinone-dependent dehydrogenase [Marinicaulis flavus]
MIWRLGGDHSLDIDGVAAASNPAPETQGWAYYGADAGGSRYAAASAITPDNVGELEIAWRYSTGDLLSKPEAIKRSAGETTPILVEDSLVFCTPFNDIIAVDPGTGKQRWRFDAKADLKQHPGNQYVCRGVAYWKDAGAQGPCAARIFGATNDYRLNAVDAKTGEPCASFGAGGTVHIDPGMSLVWPGEFQITSAPTVAGDVVVVGSSIGDNSRVAAPRGTVRAYDVRTGALRWTFDPIPRAAGAVNAGDWQGAQPPVEGHANAWAPMSYDAARNLLFVPTSSPSPDFFGGLRPGDNRYADSVVALDASTGEVVWSFQTVHHDVWDYDLPSQPGLYTVWRDGERHDVVAQTTKTGFVFVLDRDTGEPFLPVEERPVPQDGAVPGEVLSPTQPFPVAPPPLVPNTVDAKDAFGLTWFDKRACAKAIRALRHEGLFTPPSLEGTLFLPFTGGGGNWGSAAYDQRRNLLVVNMSNLAHLVQLIPADKVEATRETLHDAEISPQTGAPYGMRREILLSPLDLPCTPPPWGVLAAVDLAKGEIVWRKTLGTVEDLSGGLVKAKIGTPTLGGPMVTAGGLVFIGGTLDYYLRAFDIATGEELWRSRLPAAGVATPMSYSWRGRQYVAIFAGGYSGVDAPPGDELIAFALPN